MKARTFAIVASAACALMVAPAVFAGTSPSGAMASNFADIGKVMADFAHWLSPMFTAAKGLETLFSIVGEYFLGLALVFELFFLFVEFFVKGGASDMIARLMRLFVVTAIPLWMVLTWPELPNELFSLLTSQLGSLITQHGGSATAQISASITTLFTAVVHVVDKNVATAAGSGIVGGIQAAFLNFAILFFLLLPVLLFALALLFALFGPLLMLYVGVIFGPLLVPWMVFKPMAEFGTHWFKYMVTMGVAFLVGLVLTAISVATITAVGAVMKPAASGTIADLLNLVPLIIVLVFMAYIMLQTERIAAGLVGGPHIGAGGALLAGAMMMGRGVMRPHDPNNKNKGKADKNTGGADQAPSVGGGSSNASQADLSKQAASQNPADVNPPTLDTAGVTTPAGDSVPEVPRGLVSPGGGRSTNSADGNKDGAPTDTTTGSGGGTTGSTDTPEGTSGTEATRSKRQAVGAGLKAAAHGTAVGAATTHRFMDRHPGTRLGVAATAAVLTGPVGGAIAGAYALSPGLRRNLGGAADAGARVGPGAAKGVANGAVVGAKVPAKLAVGVANRVRAHVGGRDAGPWTKPADPKTNDAPKKPADPKTNDTHFDFRA